jgi:hypothetical protein
LFCCFSPCFLAGPNLRDLPLNLWQGLLCVIGLDKDTPAFACPDSTVSTMAAYNVLTFARYLSTLVLLKYGGASSSVLVFLSASLSLPLTNLAFQSDFLMGAFRERPKANQYLCLAVGITGLLLYAWAERQKVASAANAMTPVASASPRPSAGARRAVAAASAQANGHNDRDNDNGAGSAAPVVGRIQRLMNQWDAAPPQRAQR